MSSVLKFSLRCAFLGFVTLVAIWLIQGKLLAQAKPDTFAANLNGLAITFDADNGSILRLAYEGIVMLESEPSRATILDLATPTSEFEPLRQASRFSHGAKIDVSPNTVAIHWEKLGSSRDWVKVEGDVSATVTLTAAPDGRSIIMACSVENRSQIPVRQVIFPDLGGLLPFAGAADTTFRTSAFGMQPFVQLAPTEDTRVWHYVQPSAALSVQYTSGGRHLSDMVVRWMDFGGLKGGFSLYPRLWGWDPEVAIMLQHSEVEQKLRMMYPNAVSIAPGGKWKSHEFWLTPHTGGWAKGIESYRAWVKQHFTREYPAPKHVREGLGFRTVWMSQYQPKDPHDPIYRFKDLPDVAKESKEHGLDEMVFWCWRDELVRPMPGPYPHLGTEQDMADAVAACHKIGVNATPFVGVLVVGVESAGRYGLKVTDSGSYTYHSELIPRTGTGYATAFASVQPGTTNSLWNQDILDGCKHLADLGVPSVCFDQYNSVNAPPPNINSLTTQIRAYAKRRDPESTFSGEELRNWEIDSKYLDYTWNWGPYKDKDYRPLTSVFSAPRMNYCIDSSPLSVKTGFANNLYLCIMPRKPESTNGSDSIANYPAFSKALKQCAALRRQFLPYFTEGMLIGDCLLSSPISAHVSAYVLKDRVLMLLVNTRNASTVTFDVDLQAWLRSTSGNYRMTETDEDGKRLTTQTLGGKGKGDTGSIAPGELRVFEFIAE
jgi:hypothetical protein